VSRLPSRAERRGFGATKASLRSAGQARRLPYVGVAANWCSPLISSDRRHDSRRARCRRRSAADASPPLRCAPHGLKRGRKRQATADEIRASSRRLLPVWNRAPATVWFPERTGGAVVPPCHREARAGIGFPGRRWPVVFSCSAEGGRVPTREAVRVVRTAFASV